MGPTVPRAEGRNMTAEHTYFTHIAKHFFNVFHGSRYREYAAAGHAKLLQSCSTRVTP